MTKSLNDYEIVYINNADQAKQSPDFDAMYDLYCTCFQLPEEQQSKEEFIELLGNNPTADRAEEAWVGLKDKKTGAMAAAWNYDVFAGSRTDGVDGTIHDIFTMVHPDHREAGIFKLAMEARLQKAREFAGNPEANLVAFAEQNNPFLMTANQYIDDTRGAIDQCKRRNIFEKLDYRTLDMRYLQPPLSEEGEPNTYLDLVVKGAKDGRVASDTVREHMDRFFKLSFPEGTTLDHPDIAAMKHDLDHNESFRVNPPDKFRKLSGVFNVENLEQLPENMKDTRLGELYHFMAKSHFGAANMGKFDLAPKTPQPVDKQRLGHHSGIIAEAAPTSAVRA